MNISFIIICILIFICVLLIIKIYFVKKSIKEIEKSFNYILKEDTNNVILANSEDKTINKLTDSLNIEIKNLRSQKLQYENGNKELNRLITDISHDLRTPITAIRGFAKLLEEEKLTKKQYEYVEIINNKTNELSLLAEQLRDLSIGVDFERNVKKEKCSINELLENTIASYYSIFKEKGIAPKINICEKKIYKRIDKALIVRVFENLISNIIKYTDNDCKITLYEDGKISFINKASKLDVTTVKKIFDRYYTLDNTNTGLGLSIAKKLIELNDGNITAKYIKGELHIEVLF